MTITSEQSKSFGGGVSYNEDEFGILSIPDLDINLESLSVNMLCSLGLDP